MKINRNEYQKEWRKNNPEKAKAARKRYIEKHKESLLIKSRTWNNENRHKNKNSDLKRTFGITLKQYEGMVNAQNNLCAICFEPETMIQHGRPQALAVDHDHKTGKVRGLLCRRCNRSLGGFEDNKELLQKAINYLKEKQ